MITVEDIEKLAALSRLKLSEEEKAGLTKDMGAILAYVDQLKKVSVSLSDEPALGAVRNALREDKVLHEPNAFTEALLSLAPKREGEYVKVKKVL